MKSAPTSPRAVRKSTLPTTMERSAVEEPKVLKPRWGRAVALGFRTALGIIVLVTAIGIFSALVATKPHAPRAGNGQLKREVQVIEARQVDVDRGWRGYGTAQPLRASNLAAEVAGVVLTRPERIEEGAWVEAGDLIVQIDPKEFEDRLQRAERAMEATRAQLQALEVDKESLDDALALADESIRLWEWELKKLEEAQAGGAAQQIELERIRRQITLAKKERVDVSSRRLLIPTTASRLTALLAVEEASRSLAALDVERSRIEAPFAGFLQRVDVERGEYVNPGEQVARLVDLRVIEVPLRIGVSAAHFISIGDRATIETSRGDDVAWEGHVSRIAPEADPSTRTMTVYVVVEQEVSAGRPPSLLPGQFVSGVVYSSQQASGIVVPRTSVENGRLMVVDGEQRATPRDVRIGFYVDNAFPEIHPREKQWAVVSSGLTPGEMVIVSNLDELEPGDAIQLDPLSSGLVIEDRATTTPEQARANGREVER